MTRGTILDISLNPNRGKEVTYYVRVDGKTSAYTSEIPHIFCTKNMEATAAMRLKDKLKILLKDTGCDIYELPYARTSKRIVVVEGPRELKNILPQPFVKDERANVSQMVRWKTPIYSQVEIKDGKITNFYSEARESLEKMIDYPMAAMDFEVQDWETDNPKIFLASLVEKSGDSMKKYAFTLYEPGTIEGTEVVKVTNQTELIIALAKYINNIDPVWITGQNIMNYDLIKARLTEKTEDGYKQIGVVDSELEELADKMMNGYAPEHLKQFVSDSRKDCLKKLKKHAKQGLFAVGCDNKNPKIKGSNTFLSKTIITGRGIVDTLPYFQKKGLTQNSKLETLVRNFMGEDFEKGLGYDTLNDLAHAAEKGDAGAAKRLIEYCVKDSEKSYELGQWILPNLVAAALAFETDVSSADYTSGSNLCKKKWDKKQFKALNTYRKVKLQKYGFNRQATLDKWVWEDFDINTERAKIFSRDLKVRARQGVFSKTDNMHLVHPMFFSQVPVLKQIISEDDLMAELLDYSKKLEGKERTLCSLDLEKFLEEPLFDLESVKRKKMPSDIFYAKYGFNAKELEKSIAETISSVREFLSSNRILVVNYSPKIAIVQSRKPLEVLKKDIENSGLFSYICPVDSLISSASGRFFYRENGNTISSGMDLSGKHGNLIEPEIRMLEVFSELGLDKQYKEMMETFLEFNSRFRPGGLSIDDVAFTSKKAGVDYNQYSAKAQERDRTLARIRAKAMKDDFVKWVYGVNGITVLDGQVNPEDLNINWEKYYQKLYGAMQKDNTRNFREGSIGELLHVIFDLGNYERRDVLTRIIAGEAPPENLMKLFDINAKQSSIFEFE